MKRVPASTLRPREERVVVDAEWETGCGMGNHVAKFSGSVAPRLIRRR